MSDKQDVQIALDNATAQSDALKSHLAHAESQLGALQEQAADLKAQLQREGTAAEDARRAAEASAAEAAAVRGASASEGAAWQAKMAERKKVGGWVGGVAACESY